MSEFWTAVGLVLVIEGLLYAAAPGMAKRMAFEVTGLPEMVLRNFGMMALAAGVGVVWLVKG
jgi:uncharacterized protein YjeT (DUF2065 family)